MDTRKTLILLIDDEIDILEPLQELVESEGYSVLTAEDGERGLDLYKSHKPDLVVTDIYLPNFNGIDLLKKIKEDDQSVPVIMLSAYNYSIDSLRLKADDYLTKPPDYDYLFHSIKKLIKARGDAMELERLKKEEIEREALLSAMSCLVHELVTPINGIMCSLQFLKDEDLSIEEQNDFIETSINSSKKAVEFIRTFNSYQLLNERVLKKVVFNYTKSVQSIIEEMQSNFIKYRKNDLEILFETKFDEQNEINGDEVEIAKVLRELLTNAARWTEKGKIRVTTLNKNNTIETIVEDEGVGIDSKFHEQVFLPGQNASNPINHSSINENPYEFSKSGYGFGLAYAKRIVQFHGGTIDFQSTGDKGTKFIFSIPCN
ncbi:MAG: response regulator [Chitinispirillia bacterium]